MNRLPPSQDQLTLISRAAPCPPNTQVQFLKLQRKSFPSPKGDHPSCPFPSGETTILLPLCFDEGAEAEGGEWLPTLHPAGQRAEPTCPDTLLRTLSPSHDGPRLEW